MSKENVQPLNYCAHAIEDLKELEIRVRHAAPKTSAVYGCLVGMLQRSVKFILPNRCNLLDPHDLKQAHMDLMRLPYPVVAFEAPWENEDGDVLVQTGEFAQTVSSKRIALCWEATPEFELVPSLNSVLEKSPEGGVFVASIYWTAAAQKWNVAIGALFLPFDNVVKDLVLENEAPASRIAHELAIEAGLASLNTKLINSETCYLLPELCQRAVAEFRGDLNKVRAMILTDVRDEVLMLIQACSVINCANVTTGELVAEAKINKKRALKGKQPFFSYKVLQLSDEHRASAKGRPNHGSHARPRMHLRRGHLRHLENRVIWIRPSMINAGTPSGVVLKDYAVVPKEKA